MITSDNRTALVAALIAAKVAPRWLDYLSAPDAPKPPSAHREDFEWRSAARRGREDNGMPGRERESLKRAAAVGLSFVDPARETGAILRGERAEIGAILTPCHNSTNQSWDSTQTRNRKSGKNAQNRRAKSARKIGAQNWQKGERIFDICEGVPRGFVSSDYACGLNSTWAGVYCAKQWCAFCGAKSSVVHKRRMQASLKRTRGADWAVYIVPTLPPSAYSGMALDKDAKNKFVALRRDFVRALKRAADVECAISGWEWFGDIDKLGARAWAAKWRPHINIALFKDGRWSLSRAQLCKVSSSWDAQIKSKFGVCTKSYRDSKGAPLKVRECGHQHFNLHVELRKTREEVLHLIRYITKSTLTVAPDTMSAEQRRVARWICKYRAGFLRQTYGSKSAWARINGGRDYLSDEQSAYWDGACVACAAVGVDCKRVKPALPLSKERRADMRKYAPPDARPCSLLPAGRLMVIKCRRCALKRYGGVKELRAAISASRRLCGACQRAVASGLDLAAALSAGGLVVGVGAQFGVIEADAQW